MIEKQRIGGLGVLGDAPTAAIPPLTREMYFGHLTGSSPTAIRWPGTRYDCGQRSKAALHWRGANPTMSPTIFISAGEASGEHYGALLADALKRRLAAAGRTAQLFGMGGERMAAAGVERVVRAEDMAVMGLTEVVLHLPRIYGEFRKLKRAIRARRPDVAVLIDFPEIHFRLAEGVPPAGRAGDFFCEPAVVGVEEAPHQAGAEIYAQDAGDLSRLKRRFTGRTGWRRSLWGIRWRSCRCRPISREQFAADNGLDPANLDWAAARQPARARLATICRRCWRRRGAGTAPARMPSERRSSL